MPENFTPEDVQKGYNNIIDFSKQNDYPEDTSSGLEAMFNAEERSLSGNKTNNTPDNIAKYGKAKF